MAKEQESKVEPPGIEPRATERKVEPCTCLEYEGQEVGM